MRLIDADALVKDGYFLHRTYRQDEKTMVYETKRIEDIPTAQIEPKWIPCSERLPEDDDKVLCMTKTKKGNLNHVVGYHYSGGWACGMNRNVIAWMPLPEPYEEGE